MWKKDYIDEFGKRVEEIRLNYEEQKIWYAQCIKMVLNSTRWTLDNLSMLPTFTVAWERYGKKKPKSKVKKQKIYK